MSIIIDEIDKKILQEMCSGIYSYDDLAKKMNLTRSTVYRRIENLEKRNIVTKKIMAMPNYGILGIRAIVVGVTAHYDDVDPCIEIFKKFPHTKIVLKCYGMHEVIAVLFCQKGDEAEVIDSVQKALKDQKTLTHHLSIGYKWERFDPTPF
jgi:DNA-binding Lrp family transcriptional regulator